MASNFPADDARNSITKAGFLHQQDADIGKRVDDITSKGYHFRSEEGLDLCRLSVLDNTCIKSVIESLFEWSSLCVYKVYGRTSNDHCILNRTTSKMHGLLVMLCTSASNLVLHESSHLQALNATAHPNGLLVIPPDRLATPGITAKRVGFTNGGFALLDARLGFRIVSGQAIILAFFDRDEFQYWFKMPLPENPKLIQKVKGMCSETIALNFNFEDSEEDDNDAI